MNITPKDKLFICTLFSEKSRPGRDESIKEKINIFFKKNITSITDGIIKDVPKISAKERDLLKMEYNIDSYDWQQVKQVKNFNNVKAQATPLTIGLVHSYHKTHDRIFLVYLFILHYSSVYIKYCRKGSHNALVMKYTIDMADDRTDFKKYGCSLIKVINKKIDTFERNYSTILNKKTALTNDEIFLMLITSKTRINEMFKNLYGKYKANMHDSDIKIMMQYTETPDGKHVLSMQNLMESLKKKSVEALFSSSNVTLNRVGLTINSNDKKYRLLIISKFTVAFKDLSTASNLIIDKWVSQNLNRLTLDNFRNTFIRTMLNGRNIKHIYEEIDKGIAKMLTGMSENVTYNKLVLRNYLYRYLVMNIYEQSVRIFNAK